MGRIRVESEKMVAASPEQVYGVLEDYTRRTAILPPNYSGFRVETGGHGDGTVATYRLRVGPRERTYRVRVEVPPGEPRRIVERDETSSLVTTWELQPLSAQSSTLVRLTAEWDGAGGVGGFFERTFAPSGLRRVQQEMLDALEHTAGGLPTMAPR